MRSGWWMVCALLLAASSNLAAADAANFVADTHVVPHTGDSGKKWFVASLAAWNAANLADVASSLRKSELNPLLSSGQGTFTASSAARKLAMEGVLELVEFRLVHQRPKALKKVALLNFVAAAAISGVAIHNFHVARAASAQ